MTEKKTLAVRIPLTFCPSIRTEILVVRHVTILWVSLYHLLHCGLFDKGNVSFPLG